MISLMLLAVSAFCADDGRIITMNKGGIFLLMMSLLVHQFYDTTSWQLGKYLVKMTKFLKNNVKVAYWKILP